MLKTTPLWQMHQQAMAKLVNFSGWEMPLHYGSQLQEHHAVRNNCGLFDVSHMGIVDIEGEQSCAYLSRILANDVAKLTHDGKALYSCMLNPEAGIIDDLIAYRLSPVCYRLVINAGTREKDWDWLIAQKSGFNIEMRMRDDLAILAVQGPAALSTILALLEQDQQDLLKFLRSFTGVTLDNVFYSRTGYTGEDGFEIHVAAEEAAVFWQKLLERGATPCGLGARDTLRLEAGLNLYGMDMDESTTPLESNLGWTVAFGVEKRQFIGREFLEEQAKTHHRQLIGLQLRGQGVLRAHQRVLIPEKEEEGVITSGSYSPTLGCSIAFARIPFAPDVSECEVQIRDKKVTAQVIKPPFVRRCSS